MPDIYLCLLTWGYRISRRQNTCLFFSRIIYCFFKGGFPVSAEYPEASIFIIYYVYGIFDRKKTAGFIYEISKRIFSDRAQFCAGVVKKARVVSGIYGLFACHAYCDDFCASAVAGV